MPCPRCIARGKTWEGSDPRCGFTEDGVFTADNWSCATLSDLRALCENHQHGVRCYGHMDDSLGVLIVPPKEIVRPDGEPYVCASGVVIPDFYTAGACFIVMTWYKNRGKTSLAWEMSDADCKPLTLQTAEVALELLLDKVPQPPRLSDVVLQDIADPLMQGAQVTIVKLRPAKKKEGN